MKFAAYAVAACVLMVALVQGQGVNVPVPFPAIPAVLPPCVAGGGPSGGNPCFLDNSRPRQCAQYCDHPKSTANPPVVVGVMECTNPLPTECVVPFVPPFDTCVCEPLSDFFQCSIFAFRNVRCYEECTCNDGVYENPVVAARPNPCLPCEAAFPPFIPPGCRCDPHFRTIYGSVPFDVMGKADTTFNIISTETFQMNTKFIDSIHHNAIVKNHAHNLNTTKTFIGSVGFQTGFDQLYLNAETCTPYFNGQQMTNTEGGSDKMKFSHRMVQDTDEETDVAHLTVKTLEWEILVYCEWLTRFDKPELRFLNYEVSYTPKQDSPIPDGILGQTAEKKEYHPQHGHQGEGVIKGTWQDYIVQENDVFGSDYLYKQFDPNNEPQAVL